MVPARCPLPAFITSSLRNCAVLRARHVARGGIRAGGTPLSQRFPGQAASRAVRGRPSVALDVPVIGHAAGTLTPSSCLGRASLRAWQCSCGSCLVGPTPVRAERRRPRRVSVPRDLPGQVIERARATPGQRSRQDHQEPAQPEMINLWPSRVRHRHPAISRSASGMLGHTGIQGTPNLARSGRSSPEPQRGTPRNSTSNRVRSSHIR